MNAFENTQQTTINPTELVKNLDSSIRIMHKTMEETKDKDVSIRAARIMGSLQHTFFELGLNIEDEALKTRFSEIEQIIDNVYK